MNIIEIASEPDWIPIPRKRGPYSTPKHSICGEAAIRFLLRNVAKGHQGGFGASPALPLLSRFPGISLRRAVRPPTSLPVTRLGASPSTSPSCPTYSRGEAMTSASPRCQKDQRSRRRRRPRKSISCTSGRQPRAFRLLTFSRSQRTSFVHNKNGRALGYFYSRTTRGRRGAASPETSEIRQRSKVPFSVSRGSPERGCMPMLVPAICTLGTHGICSRSPLCELKSKGLAMRQRWLRPLGIGPSVGATTG